MNISLDWLKEFLPGGVSDAQAAADALMRGGLPVEKIESKGNDTVLDVEVTSNRSDCLSHVGIARELSALVKREITQPKITLAESTTPATSQTSLRLDAPQLCPFYSARILRNVKIGPSPEWLVRRLQAVIRNKDKDRTPYRPINNVVDVTNYVMLELGQPLHAFDFDKIGGRKIIVREAKPGESIVSIDGHDRKLSPGMLVIADEQKPIALAGVMGGLHSEVGDGTVNILLESARFDPLCVRRTARALDMGSESSYRFERGIDPTLAEKASRRAAGLILETAGGELLAGAARAGSDQFTPRQVTLRLSRMHKLLGTEIPADEAVDALERLQLWPQLSGDVITATIPSWRLDLSIEVDLIEEVARVVGYDRIPVRETISIVLTPPEPAAKAMDLVRATLVAAGYFEAVTFTFASDALAGDFLPAGVATLPRADSSVRKADARLRPSILPGLLEAVRRNETNGASGAKLFEAGATFGVDAAGKIIETRRLGLVGDEDVHAVRGAVESVLNRLDATRVMRVVPEDHAGYARGASGRIEWGGKPIGHLGRVDRAVADKLSLRDSPAAAELEIGPLIAGTQHVPQLVPLPRFPAVRRDLSLVFPESTRYDALAALIDRLKLPFLEAVEYVTTYRGKGIDKGKKVLTVRVVFRSPEATLTSELVESSVQRIIKAAGDELGGTLRT